MKVYSKSQGKVIDMPTGGGISAETPAGIPSSGGFDYERLKPILQMQALQDPKNVSKYSSLLEMFKPAEKDANVGKRKVILNQSLPVLNTVSQYALTAPTGMRGWWKAQTGKIPGVEGGPAEMLDRQTDGFARLIASAFASEVGVATDKDVRRWKRIMPRPGDTYSERVETMNNLIKQVRSEANSLGIELPPMFEVMAQSLKQRGEITPGFVPE